MAPTWSTQNSPSKRERRPPVAKPKIKAAPKAGSRAAMIAAAAALIASPVTKLDGMTEALASEDSILLEAKPQGALSKLRTYQIPMFQDQHTKVLIVECSRQIG